VGVWSCRCRAVPYAGPTALAGPLDPAPRAMCWKRLLMAYEACRCGSTGRWRRGLLDFHTTSRDAYLGVVSLHTTLASGARIVSQYQELDEL